mmetsp:Transcript_14768/g.37259  ORF Transcript_14768/g.37259 Transcript_14768/m.37259 type:complete len:300 (+) Transcript_14768:271-1170(+)
MALRLVQAGHLVGRWPPAECRPLRTRLGASAPPHDDEPVRLVRREPRPRHDPGDLRLVLCAPHCRGDPLHVRRLASALELPASAPRDGFNGPLWHTSRPLSLGEPDAALAIRCHGRQGDRRGGHPRGRAPAPLRWNAGAEATRTLPEIRGVCSARRRPLGFECYPTLGAGQLFAAAPVLGAGYKGRGHLPHALAAGVHGGGAEQLGVRPNRARVAHAYPWRAAAARLERRASACRIRRRRMTGVPLPAGSVGRGAARRPLARFRRPTPRSVIGVRVHALPLDNIWFSRLHDTLLNQRIR